MEGKNYNFSLKDKIIILFEILGLLFLTIFVKDIQIVAIAVVLSKSSKTCKNPIR